MTPELLREVAGYVKGSSLYGPLYGGDVSWHLEREADRLEKDEEKRHLDLELAQAGHGARREFYVGSSLSVPPAEWAILSKEARDGYVAFARAVREELEARNG